MYSSPKVKPSKIYKLFVIKLNNIMQILWNCFNSVTRSLEGHPTTVNLKIILNFI